MQFIPSSWRMYGTDANSDGEKDPYNPVDAIFAAARYLKAAGADTRPAPRDLRVQPRRLVRRLGDDARALISGLPADLVGSLTGLTQGHFPVHARARYADDLAERDLRASAEGPPRPQRRQDRRLERPPPLDQHLRAPRRSGDRRQRRRRQEDRQEPQARPLHRPAGRLRQPLHLRAPRQGLEALPGAEELRRATALRDEFRSARAAARRRTCRKPTAPASAGSQRATATPRPTPRSGRLGRQRRDRDRRGRRPELEKERLFANPSRPGNRETAEQTGQLLDEAGFEVFKVYFSKVLRLKPSRSQAQDPQEGVEGHRRHRPRPHRQARRGPRLQARPAPQLLDPARRPRRAADRPEADPRRLEAARGDAPSTARPARTRS